jgi:hypothetical protein
MDRIRTLATRLTVLATGLVFLLVEAAPRLKF